MRKNIMLSLAILMTSSIVYAQSTETTFTIQDTKDGERVVDVQYRNVPYEFEIDTFAQADKNGDGCLDRAEARDMGILNFDRFSLAKKGCLNEDEYMRAMRTSD